MKSIVSKSNLFMKKRDPWVFGIVQNDNFGQSRLLNRIYSNLLTWLKKKCIHIYSTDITFKKKMKFFNTNNYHLCFIT